MAGKERERVWNKVERVEKKGGECGRKWREWERKGESVEESGESGKERGRVWKKVERVGKKGGEGLVAHQGCPA